MLKRPMMCLGAALLTIAMAMSGCGVAFAEQAPSPDSVIVTPPASGLAGDATSVYGVYAFTPGGNVEVRVDEQPQVLATLIADGNGSTAAYSTTSLSPGVHQFSMTDVLSGFTLFSNSFILNGPPNIGGTSPNGAVGTPYTTALTVTGYPAPVVSIKSGALPTGLALSSTGVISGMPATGTAGKYTVVVAATNVAGQATDSLTFQIVDPSVTLTSGTTTAQGDAVSAVAQGYTANGVVEVWDATTATQLGFKNADASGNVSYSINTLAPGAHQFRFTDQSSGLDALTAAFTVTAIPTIIGTVPNAVVGQPYSTSLTVTGVPSPVVSIASGALPAGLSLSSTGIISGTPAAGTAGKHTAVVTATSSAGSASLTVSLWVVDPVLSITTGSTAAVGDPITVVGHGFSPARSIEVWDASTTTLLSTIVSDSLGNVSYSVNTLSAGAHEFLVKDLASGVNVTSSSVTVVVFPRISGTLPNAITGTPYLGALTVAGDPAPVVSISSGALPTGLSLSSTGVITGTPAAGTGGQYTAVLAATSSAGSASDSITFWVVEPIVSVTTGSLSSVGAPVTIAGQGFTPGGSVEVWDTTVPQLLATVASGADGHISYSTAALPLGAHQLLVKDVASGVSSASSSVTVVVFPTISGSLPNAIAGMPYSAALTVAGDPAPVVSIKSGALPAGLLLSSTGVISGTPGSGTGGKYTALIEATSMAGSASMTVILWVVNPAVSVTTGSTAFEGNIVTVAGEGFTPGGAVEVWVHSTPTLLATVTAGPGGAVQFDASSLPQGVHHIVLKDLASGTEASSTTFTVAPTQVVSSIANNAAPGVRPRVLASTGADATCAITLILVLLGIGSLAFLASRERKGRARA